MVPDRLGGPSRLVEGRGGQYAGGETDAPAAREARERLKSLATLRRLWRVYTLRGEDIRLISARRATHHEVKDYAG